MRFTAIALTFALLLASSECAQTISAEGGYYTGSTSNWSTPEEAANDGVCGSWFFLFDENQCPLGTSVCVTACQCDGRRTCVNGCCVGQPRTAQDLGYGSVSNVNTCLSSTYSYDEAATNNRCTTPCACDGNRFCSTQGYCHGTARYNEACTPTESDMSGYQVYSNGNGDYSGARALEASAAGAALAVLLVALT